MKRLLLIIVIFFCMGAQAVECIQPKYARSALMKLYLQQQYPDFSSELPILRRISAKAGEKVSREIGALTGDVLACFLHGSKDNCPNNKKSWTRQDHIDNGWKTLDKYQDAMTLTEKMFLYEQLTVWVQESNCSDF